ncbi:hypothetical protein [Geoalkalibacter halelectricus]|uniref:Virus attachment protein p12 family protein n=1 Tax=Geoalkalibacter halelectricus TaxID=2847045 RepID=A0ABY5ZMY2_9BACT|nr:hypothetical protein [Geoalkalibacter halelectricus]MDO3378703.1 hypothetical protein [Geoalkalibacter halelectricus]UWZ79988.1 hypothetical protein L9S41_00985 [Geoalkalibacter halelectricus]
MTTFLAVLLLFLLAFAALGLGLFFRRPPLRRRCGEPDDCKCADEGRRPEDYCGREDGDEADRCRH